MSDIASQTAAVHLVTQPPRRTRRGCASTIGLRADIPLMYSVGGYGPSDACFLL